MNHHLENKNPENREGITPLHLAAENGFYDICQIIVDNIKNGDKNPVDGIGNCFSGAMILIVHIHFFCQLFRLHLKNV